MNANSQISRVYYLDVLRLFATLAVIMMHASGWFLHDDMMCRYAGNLFAGLSRWAVPVFLMISGAIFLQPEKSVPIQSLYRKYILRLTIALISWQLLYVMLFDPIRPLLREILHGSELSYQMGALYPLKYHLWFLPMLIGIYICLPILKAIASNRRIMIYYLLIWALYSTYDSLLLIPSLHIDILSKMVNSFQLHMIYGFSGYFLLGYYLSTQQISKRLFWISALIFVIAFGVLVIGENMGYEAFVLEDWAPTILLMSTSVFICVKYVCTCTTHNLSFLSGIENYARSGLFGIYLIHPFILSLFPLLDCVRGSIAFLIMPLFACLVFSISLFCIKLMQYIPYLKYICS